MKVKAIRNDSWLGIKNGEMYDAEEVETVVGKRIKVYTEDCIVFLNRSDFEIVDTHNDPKAQ
ncbi:hypothetical protein B0H94_11854 [Salsuginibacillus halophilus]|uniref:Uncharacterized protein n=1 Tax=Salsuginibacillus halophilus TaxID=517424 RepID=A0A2P8H6A9_9BACI|nr:hypothetical protein [Salsuginibacillus halophilus]PSL41741.1 hypothetical protein B0H94_11854 [Salsuginibacillus halophilus]